MNRIRINNDLIVNQQKVSKNTTNYNPQRKSFQEVLNEIGKSQEVKFSKHALERLKNRNINLSKEDISRLNNGVQRADRKGVKEALILMENKAFIASVKNKTIITAACEDQLKENVFTNIDGAVIV
ncbi:TIGR02530 family flagellar biosynthesis protein [Maledivibacter halophilus]|uniref:Flagellar operon protein n=1 Tax=Maledivibacter halophilus TaxID=36842 RepID=A0A1T5LEI9_9FIRM|nr:TIGR02530 family flagellar biosynthesis protein [Maledivibacter halophilus]SKC74401.1 flagellar operon protein [Maledivibacter halophilus]